MIELDEIKETVTHMAEVNSHKIIERGEALLPVAFVFHTDGSVGIQGMMFETKAEKQEILKVVSSQSSLPDVTAVALLLDTYMMAVESKQKVDYISAHGGVAAQPERQEALLIAIVERDAIVATGTQRYDRVLESPKIHWHDWIWRGSAERGF